MLGRYPDRNSTGTDIDEEMTKKVLGLMENDVELKGAVSGVPKIRSAIKV